MKIIKFFYRLLVIVYKKLRLTMYLFVITRVLFYFNFKFKTVYDIFISSKLLKPEGSNPIRQRKTTFDYVIDKLYNRKDMLIIETGCMRADHGKLSFGDDGASTFIFNCLAKYTGSTFISVDISEKNIEHARNFCKDTTFQLSDSIEFLTEFKQPELIDLIYFDSYDFDPNNPLMSQNHHLQEFQAVYNKLKNGCIIVIDDADAKMDGTFFGKGSKIREHLQKQNIFPLIESYQLIYIK